MMKRAWAARAAAGLTALALSGTIASCVAGRVEAMPPGARPAVTSVATAPTSAPRRTPRAIAKSPAKTATSRAPAAATPKPTPKATPDATTPAPTGARQAAANAAAAYATGAGWRTGIAVVDLTTGQVTTAGDATGRFPAESTVKVLLAANLLATGQMSGEVAAEAHQMITASDDGCADDLYELAGGDEVTAWAAARYDVPALGEPPANGAGQWGSTPVSAVGMARFLAAAANDPAVGPWLVATMKQVDPVAADGTNQLFGLKAAAPAAAVKQGWGGDVPGMDAETAPSIGYVDGRYAVAIYTLHEPQVDQSAAEEMVTAQAKLLLPDGHVPRI